VDIFRTKYRGLNGGTKFVENMSGDEPKLILLPQFLSMISYDFSSRNVVNDLLRVVDKYPLLEPNHKPDGLTSLRKQVFFAAEVYLGTYSRVSLQFYTERIPLIRTDSSAEWP
jgi:hypothetical protein